MIIERKNLEKPAIFVCYRHSTHLSLFGLDHLNLTHLTCIVHYILPFSPCFVIHSRKHDFCPGFTTLNVLLVACLSFPCTTCVLSNSSVCLVSPLIFLITHLYHYSLFAFFIHFRFASDSSVCAVSPFYSCSFSLLASSLSFSFSSVALTRT